MPSRPRLTEVGYIANTESELFYKEVFMLSRLAKWAFDDSLNATCVCGYLTLFVALYFQGWSWWIPGTLFISFFISALISAGLYGAGNEKSSKNKFLFGSYKVALIFFLLGSALVLPINYFFHLNYYNLVLFSVAYTLTFNILYHNFYEKDRIGE